MEATSFSHGCVRDLAWAGFAPTLLRGEGLSGAGLVCDEFWQQRLRELDADPAPLLEFLGESTSGRLGLYYERLWHYLLDQDPDTELLAHNLPIRDGSRTIGEFDCLYWSERQQTHVHLELAVKFYLGLPDQDLWLGPGAHDRLDLKLERLLEHQARLSQHPAAAEPLAELGISTCKARIEIKGYLFSPSAGMDMPDTYNPANRVQHWHPLTEFLSLPPLPTDWVGWQKIPRGRWLSAFHANEGKLRDKVTIVEWLQDRLLGSGRPALLAACNENGIETQRCFVTPDPWPEATD